MSPEAAVSVPGKAILLGEHAAVYGHPALVTAVDLRLTAVARATPEPFVTIAGPSEFHTGPMSRDETADLRRGTQAPGDRLAYLACASALEHAQASSAVGVDVRIASGIPPGSGLGSSAALAVGVVAAVLGALGVRSDGATIARLAKEVETRQHGRPSGVDVEAVLRGGTQWCRRTEGALACEALTPADTLLDRLELYHAGTPAESTGEMVAAVARLLKDQPARGRAALAAIEDATCEARELLLGSPAGSVHERLRPLIVRAEAALEDLEVVPGHVASAIRRIEAAGGAAKISGAGGRTAGAGLVIVLPPAGASAAVPAAWARLTCRLDAPGLLEDVAV